MFGNGCLCVISIVLVLSYGYLIHATLLSCSVNIIVLFKPLMLCFAYSWLHDVLIDSSTEYLRLSNTGCSLALLQLLYQVCYLHNRVVLLQSRSFHQLPCLPPRLPRCHLQPSPGSRVLTERREPPDRRRPAQHHASHVTLHTHSRTSPST